MSNTAEWKLIPFAQNTISRDQMTTLIQKQNKYLHETHAISFINVGSLEGSFWNTKVEVSGKRKMSSDEEGGKGDDYESNGEEENEGETDEDTENKGSTGDTEMEYGQISQETSDNQNNEETKGRHESEVIPDQDAANGVSNEEGSDGGLSHMEEDTFLQMIQNSAEEGGSLFTSWEPGCRGQFYF